MWTCGHCQNTSFVEGMRVAWCPRCQFLLHAGCARKHVQALHANEDLVLRQGLVGGYGVIKWSDAEGQPPVRS